MEEYSEYDDYYNEYETEDIAEVEYEDMLPIGDDTTIKQMYDDCMEPTLFSASDQIGILFISCLVYKISTQLSNIEFQIHCNPVFGPCLVFNNNWGLSTYSSYYTNCVPYNLFIFWTFELIFDCRCQRNIYINNRRVVLFLYRILLQKDFWNLFISLYALTPIGIFGNQNILISLFAAYIYTFAKHINMSLPAITISDSLRSYVMSMNMNREYFDVISESWEQVRGVQMIIVLKTLSVCFEIVNDSRKSVPSLLEYLGYIFCPATVVFGPWMSLEHYNKVYERRAWSFGWVVKVFATSTFAFLCLGISSCWVYWLFLGTYSSWLIAVRDALSVRFSHYFIAIMSEATSVLSGFYSIDGSMNIEVCKPWKIEFPRSLVEVVVYWNMPMHKWLKMHVFRPLSHLSSFWPLILTFLASSMLHGLNFGLTMVLLSLGIYTHAEHTLRDKLSSIFDACVRSRACAPNCGHSFKADHFVVLIVNIVFRFWAYFHLSYLGIMMDKSGRKSDSVHLSEHFGNELKRWQTLNYASHWAVFATYLGAMVV